MFVSDCGNTKIGVGADKCCEDNVDKWASSEDVADVGAVGECDFMSHGECEFCELGVRGGEVDSFIA